MRQKKNRFGVGNATTSTACQYLISTWDFFNKVKPKFETNKKTTVYTF